MTSLEPWTAADVAKQFALDYGEDESLWPFTRRTIAEFMRSREVRVLEL